MAGHTLSMSVQLNAAWMTSCTHTPCLELLLGANQRHFTRKKVSEAQLKLVHLKMHKQDIK